MKCDWYHDFNVHAELDAVILSRKTKALAYKLNDETFLEIRKFRLFTMYNDGEHLPKKDMKSLLFNLGMKNER